MTNILSPFYKKVKKRFHSRAPCLYFLADKNKTIIKFLFAGSLAAIVHFSILYILTDLVGVWYIFSTSVAFVIAFFVSFFSQKFWTFRENTTHGMTRQMGVYMGVGIMNLFLNGAGMYLVVDFWGIMYLFAQALVGLIVAIETFLIYRYIIFEKNRKWI